jgi:hypothetical protein
MAIRTQKVRQDISYNEHYNEVCFYGNMFNSQEFNSDANEGCEVYDLTETLRSALRNGPSPEFYDEDDRDHGNWADDVDAQNYITECAQNLVDEWDKWYGSTLPANHIFRSLMEE